MTTTETVTPSGLAITPAEVTLERPYPAPSNTADSLCRRLRTALLDLGLLTVIGENWASPSSEGIVFDNLSITTADYVVRHLEDLGSPPYKPWLRPSAEAPSGPGSPLFSAVSQVGDKRRQRDIKPRRVRAAVLELADEVAERLRPSHVRGDDPRAAELDRRYGEYRRKVNRVTDGRSPPGGTSSASND